jgi:hypothetical protein
MKTLLALVFALSALAATVPVTAAENILLAQASGAAPQKYKVVIQVSDPDPRLWAQAMNYSENLPSELGKENVEIEIVALGHGIGILKLDSPQGSRIPNALKRGVKISACQVTMKRQKLTKDDMLPDIGYVPGGLVRILELQRQGWNYIKG